MSSHPRIPHPVLEAGTIFYQVGNIAATEGIIEHFQEDFIKKGEEEAFQLEQNYNLLNFKYKYLQPGPKYRHPLHSEDC